jgi:hypothetical protein
VKNIDNPDMKMIWHMRLKLWCCDKSADKKCVIYFDDRQPGTQQAGVPWSAYSIGTNDPFSDWDNPTQKQLDDARNGYGGQAIPFPPNSPEWPKNPINAGNTNEVEAALGRDVVNAILGR